VNETLGRFFTPEHLRGMWFGARVKRDGDRMRLARVEPDSPAAKAGLRAGDTILEVNDVEVGDFVTWAEQVAGRGLEKVRFKIFRGGRIFSVVTTLLPEEKVFNSDLIQKRLGLTVRTLTQQLAEQLGLSFYGGYLITKVEAGSPAERAGLELGGVIQHVDGQPPSSLVALAKTIHGSPAGHPVKLGVVWEVRRGAFLQRRSGVATVKVR